ncbi:phage tail tape measure protein [Profundibacterium mesophilum]|uniref:Tape measure protein n=1 Tax=Profundibacterium mesophilum KAUST100406-0324 TaxID=1037889 RepID=A0A921NS18_9RHOB|nr:phage tail tape measure protein [Profundibacterium mesophilum]KAF0676727.1 putative tape measure protein [Profundibacterium mesophilum KAUST100406-0324]
MRDMNVEIVMRLINKVRGPAREVEDDLRGINSRVATLGRAAGRMALGIGAAGAAATANAVRAAATAQDAWSEANKTLGLSSEGLGRLKDDIDDLAQDIPLATREFIAMAGTAGNMGITDPAELRGFLRDASTMFFAMDGIDGAAIMGNWRASLGATQDEIRAIADQVNHMGNTSSAGAAPLAKFAADALAAGKAIGYATEETLAFGTAMIAAGTAPEAAKTSFLAMNRTMVKGMGDLSSSQTRQLEKIGLTEEWAGLQRRMATDATSAIREVVGAISAMPDFERAGIVSQLFGEEAGRELLPILSDLEKYDSAMARIGDVRANAAGSMQKELEAVSDDVIDNWQRLKNAFATQNVGAGEMFLDPINDALKEMTGALLELDEAAGLWERIRVASVGVATSIAKLIMPDAWVDWMNGNNLVDWLRNAADFSWSDVMPSFSWSDIIPEMPSLISWGKADEAASLTDQLRDALSGTFTEWDEGLAAVERYEQGLIEVEALHDILAGKAATTGADARRAAEALQLLGAGQGAPAAPQAPTIEDMRADGEDVAALQRRIERVSKAAGALPRAIAETVREANDALSGLDLEASGRAMMDALADGIVAGTARVIAAVQAMAAKVDAAMPRTAQVSLAAGAAPGAPVQARAGGGGFGPGWLLTGERGPELEYRDRGGFIAHHGQLREMVSMSERAARGLAVSPPRGARAPGSGTAVTIGDINIYPAPGADPVQIAQAVRAEIARSARQGSRGAALHDGGDYDA